MENQELKQLYTVLERSADILNEQLKTTYLEAAQETLENLLTGTVHVADGLPDQASVEKLQALYKDVTVTDLDAETIRQAIQLLLVRVMQHDGVDANRQLTPDVMAQLATFVVTTMTKKPDDALTVADIAAGTGNLLYAMMNQLQAAWQVKTRGTAIDNDGELLDLADISGQLQHAAVDFYHQDALAPLTLQPQDVVVADLPVGYYPLDERARQFETASKDGHSYAHHLLIERGMQLVKPGGLGLFFVPSAVFESEEAKGLTEWLAKHVYFQGLLNLPVQLFANEKARKALLILQQTGGDAHQAPQVLLGDFPEVSDRANFAQFLDKVRSWANNNLK